MTGVLVSLLGAPGSGKTTVARWLAAAMDADLILEDYAGNPFLAESYRGANELKLPGQLWFLLSRVNQLTRVRWPAGRRAVSDYAYVQDRIYADVWLSGEAKAAYDDVAGSVGELVQPAGVLVHLDSPVELLSRRVAGRGRDYETTFTPEFLRHLRDACRRAAGDATAPVVEVDVARRDLADESQQQWLVAELSRILGETPTPAGGRHARQHEH